MKSVCGLDVHNGLVEMKKAATSLMAWVAALQMNAEIGRASCRERV